MHSIKNIFFLLKTSKIKALKEKKIHNYSVFFLQEKKSLHFFGLQACSIFFFGGLSASQVFFAKVDLQHFFHLQKQRIVIFFQFFGNIVVHGAFADSKFFGGAADSSFGFQNVVSKQNCPLFQAFFHTLSLLNDMRESAELCRFLS